MSRPITLSEWQTHIQQFAGMTLFSQLVAANSQTFARTLLAEGYTMTDVEEILRMFVRQCKATQTPIPEEGPFNLKRLIQMEKKVAPVDPTKLLQVHVVDRDDELGKFLESAKLK